MKQDDYALIEAVFKWADDKKHGEHIVKLKVLEMAGCYASVIIKENSQGDEVDITMKIMQIPTLERIVIGEDSLHIDL